ncbi:hypothetical protein ACFVUH_35290 [Kitasatospora sp. NPDC058032]|uniref:hypothetical protein n=1 Tax=Kitasatospora sp. NPDC058032 TaxID=3346307 RepID=UPI0036D99461
MLHSEPSRGDYTTVTTVPLGDPLDLPEPFDFTLDTAELVEQVFRMARRVGRGPEDVPRLRACPRCR